MSLVSPRNHENQNNYVQNHSRVLFVQHFTLPNQKSLCCNKKPAPIRFSFSNRTTSCCFDEKTNWQQNTKTTFSVILQKKTISFVTESDNCFLIEKMPCNWPILFVIFLKICSAYKPVVLIHGILTGPGSMLIIEGEVKRVKDRYSISLIHCHLKYVAKNNTLNIIPYLIRCIRTRLFTTLDSMRVGRV